MKVTRSALGLLALSVSLAGCADKALREQLDQASAAYEQVSHDADLVRTAPKDVARAGETLERAQRFSHYTGGAEDARHYAYLSLIYSEIARQHGALLANQQEAVRLQMDRERLRRMLQDARLLNLQQGQWMEDQLISLAATETDRGLVMTLGDVLFRAGSDRLGPEANRTLLKLAHFLQLNPQRKVRIEGYTDSRGDAQENLELSRARAQAVASILTDLGIDAQRIDVRGYGEQFPVAENASARGRAQNRRVEILFSDPQGRFAPDR